MTCDLCPVTCDLRFVPAGLVTLGDLVPQIALASQSKGPNLHKNSTALRPDKFSITSTSLQDDTAISK